MRTTEIENRLRQRPLVPFRLGLSEGTAYTFGSCSAQRGSAPGKRRCRRLRKCWTRPAGRSEVAVADATVALGGYLQTPLWHHEEQHSLSKVQGSPLGKQVGQAGSPRQSSSLQSTASSQSLSIPSAQ